MARSSRNFAATIGAAWAHQDGKGFSLKLDYLAAQASSRAYPNRNAAKKRQYIRGHFWSSFQVSNRTALPRRIWRVHALSIRENGGSLTPQNHLGQITEFVR